MVTGQLQCKLPLWVTLHSAWDLPDVCCLLQFCCLETSGVLPGPVTQVLQAQQLLQLRASAEHLCKALLDTQPVLSSNQLSGLEVYGITTAGLPQG